MTTEVDICNMALGLIGQETDVQAITPAPDGSADAENCARFYPIARRHVLGRHLWGFATKRVTLAAATPGVQDIQPAGWAYVYAKPSNCITPIALLPPQSGTPLIPLGFSTALSDANFQLPSDMDAQEFIEETLFDNTAVFYTNCQSPVLRYIIDVTDASKFPPLVVTAIGRLLASFLCGSIIKGDEGRKESMAQRKYFESIDLPAATAANANGRRVTQAYGNAVPAAIQARR